MNTYARIMHAAKGSYGVRLSREEVWLLSVDTAIQEAAREDPEPSVAEVRAHMERHTCHWLSCNVAVPPRLWGCKTHWFMLPPQLRSRIQAAYHPGQEIDKKPSREYLDAAQAVQDWIRQHEITEQTQEGRNG